MFTSHCFMVLYGQENADSLRECWHHFILASLWRATIVLSMHCSLAIVEAAATAPLAVSFPGNIAGS